MKKFSTILATTALFACASAANAAYVVTGTGNTVDDTYGAPLATQTADGTATVTLDGGGAFSSITMDLSIVTTSSAGVATVTSTSTFDATGTGTNEILTCVGISQVCDNAGVGVVTATNPQSLDFSDLTNITWFTQIQKPSPIVAGGTATVTLNLAATEVSEVPVPAAAWLFGSALVGLAGVGRKRKVA